jgi:hypothetical protein
MIRPEPQVIKGLAMAVRQHPEVLGWLDGVYKLEMKRLPYAVDNPAVSQGRCQMLGELIEFAKSTPDLAAKL